MKQRNEESMRILLAHRCRQAGSQKVWAERNGFSAAFISDVLNERRDVTEAVAEALGYERTVCFLQKSLSSTDSGAK